LNIELLEKLKAIRETLVALQAQAQVGDAKKVAELVKHTGLWSNYNDLLPYMNGVQKMNFDAATVIAAQAETYLRTGKDHLTAGVTKRVPQMLADLDDIAKKLEGEGP
jgi:hypothetical protein